MGPRDPVQVHEHLASIPQRPHRWGQRQGRECSGPEGLWPLWGVQAEAAAYPLPQRDGSGGAEHQPCPLGPCTMLQISLQCSLPGPHRARLVVYSIQRLK